MKEVDEDEVTEVKVPEAVVAGAVVVEMTEETHRCTGGEDYITDPTLESGMAPELAPDLCACCNSEIRRHWRGPQRHRDRQARRHRAALAR